MGGTIETILPHDRASEVMLKRLTQDPNKQNTDGPTRMEVDGIEKRKGTKKNKAKQAKVIDSDSLLGALVEDVDVLVTTNDMEKAKEKTKESIYKAAS